MTAKARRRKDLRARSKRDIFIEVSIKKGRTEQIIRSTNPSYVIRKLREEL